MCPLRRTASDTRRKLYDPARVLTASELARWVTEQESPAPAEQPGPHEITLASSNSLQPVLPFDVSPSYEARQEAVAAIPERFRPQVEKTLGLVSECVNGTWKKVQGLIFGGVLVRNNDDFRHGLAKVYGVSYSFVYGKLHLFRSWARIGRYSLNRWCRSQGQDVAVTRSLTNPEMHGCWASCGISI